MCCYRDHNCIPICWPPPSTSVGENVDASDISGDSTQKLPGQSPKNAEMEAVTTETSAATPSAGHPPSTSVGANYVASDIPGDSTQKLIGQFPKNAERAADTTEISTATPPADLPPPTSVPLPIAESTTSGTFI